MKLGLHYWTFSTPADPAAIAPTLAETDRVAGHLFAEGGRLGPGEARAQAGAAVTRPALAGTRR
ncbi:hypothetical protein [Micromonospora haikouensis]|nr:hypothetical protein [Micromonospora haikouensis]